MKKGIKMKEVQINISDINSLITSSGSLYEKLENYIDVDDLISIRKVLYAIATQADDLGQALTALGYINNIMPSPSFLCNIITQTEYEDVAIELMENIEDKNIALRILHEANSKRIKMKALNKVDATQLPTLYTKYKNDEYLLTSVIYNMALKTPEKIFSMDLGEAHYASKVKKMAVLNTDPSHLYNYYLKCREDKEIVTEIIKRISIKEPEILTEIAITVNPKYEENALLAIDLISDTEELLFVNKNSAFDSVKEKAGQRLFVLEAKNDEKQEDNIILDVANMELAAQR